MKAIILTDDSLRDSATTIIKEAFLKEDDNSLKTFNAKLTNALNPDFDEIIFFNESDARIEFLANEKDFTNLRLIVLRLPASSARPLGRSFGEAQDISIADLESLGAVLRPDLAKDKVFQTSDTFSSEFMDESTSDDDYMSYLPDSDTGETNESD
jgi:hypothetical protein